MCLNVFIINATCFLLLLLLCLNVSCKYRNNVCKTLPDYATIHRNKNCWFNPDVDASPADIIKRYNYPFEQYKITTEDGYILGLFRIPYSTNRSSNNDNDKVLKQPILLQHGVALDSVAWLMTGKNSPAFQLSDKGFDVWLSNMRGTRYSMDHLNLTIADPKYWNYSFHEAGLFDLPAIINFISQKTGRKIVYIGHSMGTTSSYVYASLRPDHARNKVSRIISLAPVAYISRVNEIVRKFVPFRAIIAQILTQLGGVYGFGQLTELQQQIMRKTCLRYPIMIACLVGNSFLTGLSLEEVQPQYYPVFLSNYPKGTSLKTVLHYAQIIATNGRFQQYDYGERTNLRLYGTVQPPAYNIGDIDVPINLLYGEKDFLADKSDVKVLYDRLQTNKTITSIFSAHSIYFSHNDFLLGKDIDRLYEFIRTLIIS